MKHGQIIIRYAISDGVTTIHVEPNELLPYEAVGIVEIAKMQLISQAKAAAQEE